MEIQWGYITAVNNLAKFNDLCLGNNQPMIFQLVILIFRFSRKCFRTQTKMRNPFTSIYFLMTVGVRQIGKDVQNLQYYFIFFIYSWKNNNAEGFDTSASIEERLLCRWCSRRCRTNWHPTVANVHRRMTALQFAVSQQHRSADLPGGSEEELQQLDERIDKTAAGYCMEISSNRSKILINSIKPRPSTNIWMTGKTQEEVDQFKYLGSTQTKDGTSIKEVKIRLAQTHSVITRLVIL